MAAGDQRDSAAAAEAVRIRRLREDAALEDERCWEDIEAGLGALAGSEHEWDADPAGWVEAQRNGDPTRVG